VKLPLDMKTVRRILGIARELYRRGEFSESNLILGLVLAGISDTKWFGTGLRDWVTLWNPEREGRAKDPDIDFERAVLPVANHLIQSGRRSQWARQIAAIATVWPTFDWQEIDWKQSLKFDAPKLPQPGSQEFKWLEEAGLVQRLKGRPEAIAILGGTLSHAWERPLWSYAEEFVNSLPAKDPVLLTELEIQTVANGVYDFHWSGRSEAAVRLSMALPRAGATTELYSELTEATGRVPPISDGRILQGAAIGRAMENKGYLAEGSNLFLDSLNLEDDSAEWSRLFAVVEPTVQRATSRPPKAVSSWVRGVTSKLTNESPTAGGPPPSEETGMVSWGASQKAERYSPGGGPSPRNSNIEGGSASPPDEASLEVSEQPDPPRSAYALLKCDDAVIASVEFPLTVGLSKDPDADVFGDHKLERPPSSVGPYTLQVQITADGFRIGLWDLWRNQLSVTADNPYPSVTVHLTPEMHPTKNLWSRTITAVYSVDGHTIGVAIRSVAIVRGKEYLDRVEPKTQDSSATFSIPTDTVAPDLTVTIVRGKSSGRLLWTLTTPWKEILTPSLPLEIDVGGDGDGPKEYARQLVDSVNANEGKATLYKHLIGRGTEVGDLVPPMFWEVLQAVAKKSSNKLPTILILSAEPYIPWELAVLKPPLDPALPPFLGAQAIVGRWVLANRGPKLPPPREQQAQTIAVVSGVYDRLPGWRRLHEAEAEAKDIQTQWSAVPVDARTDPVLKCIDGTPPGDVLHFALHGIYDPNSTQNGLILVDGQPLDPTTVKGSTLTRTPFVFLNACQVGSGNSVLGDYSGMAAAFLHAGASGVVAPLWSVKDTIAREIALRFYEKTFRGTTPAEFLRSERSQFTDSGVISATCLAYQFFGHPAMRLVR
jgi:hypothetical protein